MLATPASVSLARPLCIVGDVHLARGQRPAVARALASLVEAHPGHEIVLNGDTFDLSVDPPGASAARSIASLLDEHREARDALRAHRGGVSLVAGNHDAAIVGDEARAALGDALGDVQITPWVLRRGSVHIEHGHLYDPDNAPTHPLSPSTHETEPLGVALTRRFVARSGAFDFAHAHETTPLAGITRVFRLHGPRALLMVRDYYVTAFRLVLEAGRQRGLEAEREAGRLALAGFAAEVGLDAAALERLLESVEPPTHHGALDTFLRLYLDRSIATVGLAASMVVAGPSALLLGGLSASYLAASIARGVNRYGGRLEQRALEVAEAIRALTHASTVVLGHTHRPVCEPGHVNPGSFAFVPAGQPRGYVLVDERGEASRSSWPS